MIIYNLICIPLNDYTFTLEKFFLEKNKILIHNLDLTEIFFERKNINQYKKNNNFHSHTISIFKDKNQFINFINKKSISSKVIFCLPNFNQVDDFWLLRYFKKNNYNFFISYRVNPLPKPPSQNFHRIFRQLKYIIRDRIKINFKLLLYKNTNFYQKPIFLITSGQLNFYWKKKLKIKNLIKVPSPQISWDIKSETSLQLIFVDEFTSFRRDSQLFSMADKNENYSEYYKEMNLLFDFLESKYKARVIICCSNKHKYYDNPYKNRNIVYGQTLNYISKSKLVIGHDSDALFQAVYQKKKILIYKAQNLSEYKKIRIQNFSTFFNLSCIDNSYISDENMKRKIYKIKSIDNSKIIRDYFYGERDKNTLTKKIFSNLEPFFK